MGAGAGLPFNFSGIINNLMKQMSKEMKDMNPQDMGSINISISGDGKPMIKMNDSNSKVEPLKKMLPVFSEEQLAKFSELPKKEPKTNVRRLSQKILYELDMPGVKNSKDVMINKLETGIEIRAIASKAAYFKTISLGMQLLNYKLSKEKLVLEFKA
jgi:HSP20 family molecular chaperone IbpA